MNLPGLDLDRLGNWLPAHVPGAGNRLEGTLIAGGKSNLTFAVTDGTQEWIVRRPPMGHVLPTAHDMAREYRVMSALTDTAVPVPRTFAFCSDADVLGAQFYVMERCTGTPYRRASELAALGPERTRIISANLVDTLAALHAVDPEAVSLGDFGRPKGFLRRQVARWMKQLEATDTGTMPGAEELHRLLTAEVPAESAVGIVHGDFRLDNILVDQDRATAVLDWEMATLGDPLTDLALMVVHGRLGEIVNESTVIDATSAPGFLSEDEIIARYAHHSDRDLSHFGFYLGLASFKLAVILDGIRHRHLQGKTVGEGFESIGDAIDPLLETGLNALKEHH